MEELEGLATVYNQKTYRRKKLKILEEFKDHYERNSVEENVLNLVRLADSSNTLPPLRADIFSSVREVVDCDIIQLTDVYMYIRNNLLKAAQQKMMYDIVKRGYQDIKGEEGMDWFNTVHKSFQLSVLHCMKNAPTYAAKIAVEENEPQKISIKLKGLYPWLKWAVVKTSDEETSCDFSDYIKSGYKLEEDTGNNFKQVNGKDSVFLIVWQDDLKSIDYATHNCALNSNLRRNQGASLCYKTEDIQPFTAFLDTWYPNMNIELNKIRNQKYNSVGFKGTSFVPKGMLSGYCWKYIQDHLALDCFQSSGGTNWEKDIKQKWIISDGQNEDLCKSETSSGNSHGECHSIDNTDLTYWICQEGYEGKNCSENSYQELEDLKKTGLDSLREKLELYSTWTGLPTLVDVWLEVEGLEGKLKTFMNQVLKDQTKEIIFSISYIDVLKDSHYIIDLHGRYSFNSDKSISEDYFKTELYNLFTKNSIDKFLYELTQAMQDGYLYYEKKKIALQTTLCSPQYKTKLESFKDTMKMSEMVIKKSLLQYISWRRLDSQSKDEDNRYEEVRNTILQSFNLEEHWGKASCSEISPNAMDVFSICEHGDSFEGAAVKYNCPPDMSGNIQTATCKKHRNGTHYWDLTMSEHCPGCKPPTLRQDNTGSTELTCHYLWSPWTAWSACDNTCDGCQTAQCKGEQTRDRLCAGNTAVSTEKCRPSTATAKAKASISKEHKPCNDQNCCQAQNKFQCNSGKCIKRSWLCDGDYDCPGQEDENVSNCPNTVRNGDDIALKVDRSCNPKGYLSCGNGYCQIRECGTCTLEKFRIYGSGLSVGDPIKLYGDSKATIGFYDGHITKWIDSDGSHRWLSCDCYSYCSTRGCPGSPTNPEFADVNTGRCTWESFEIKQLQGGKVLQYNINVKLKTKKACSSTYWLSGYKNYVQTTYDTGNCETWRIFKR
eukprot:GFUD01004189.1.p1 GENE.GFUD01004189.1~~GFUD01004189.1.p1  ORF type:complete len:1045 (+),score=138.74 GFUD01004189.1:307-3135(+)